MPVGREMYEAAIAALPAPAARLPGEKRAHGFAPPPHDGFALIRALRELLANYSGKYGWSQCS